MIIRKHLMVLSLLCVFLTGCWDQLNIQDVLYATALGIDYKDNQYVLTAQYINLATVAKLDKGPSAEPLPVWTQTGKGATVTSAYTDLLTTTQERLVFNHLTVCFFSKNAMKKGIDKMVDGLYRHPETRFIMWMYGTHEDIQKILTLQPPFNESSIHLFTYAPKEIHKIQGWIPTIQSYQFIRSYLDQPSNVMLPSVKIVNTWNAGKNPQPVPALDGAFFIQGKTFRKWMSVKDLQGYRWVRPFSRRTTLFSESQKGSVLATVADVKTKIITTSRNGKPVFHLKITGRGLLLEKLGKPTDVDKMVNQKVAEEVRTTFNKGVKANLDVYNLENNLFRADNQLWKQTFADKHLTLQKEMLGDVQADIKVSSSGSLMMREEP